LNTAERTLTICVLGGTGFVGKHLVTELALEGHWVRVPTRTYTGQDQLRVLSTVELVRADVHDPRVLTQLFADVDVVINLVAILNEHGRRASFQLVHTELAAKVVAAARAARVRRLLHMSSLGADARNAPSRYLRSKGQADVLIRDAPHLDYTIFRPSVIFGPDDSLTNRFASLLHLGAGFMPLARPNARFAPVSVHDVTHAFRRALRDPATIGRTYELCGPEVMTLAQIVRLTAEIAHLRCWILPLPNFVAYLQALVFGLIPGKPFSLDNYRSLTVDNVCTANGCAVLGIQPQPMRALLPGYLA